MKSNMGTAHLAEIRARVAAVPSGPWTVPGYDQAKSSRQLLATVRVELSTELTVQVVPDYSAGTATAEFISHAIEDVPDLLARVDQLETAMRSALGVLDSLAVQRSHEHGGIPVSVVAVTGAIADELRQALGA